MHIPPPTPQMIVRHLHGKGDKGKVTAPEIQHMHGVVVFCDISGFTALSEMFAQQGGLGAEQLGFYLNRYFEMLVRCIAPAVHCSPIAVGRGVGCRR